MYKHFTDNIYKVMEKNNNCRKGFAGKSRLGLLLGVLVMLTSATTACAGNAGTATEKQEHKTEKVMKTDKMKLYIGGKTFTATMEDNVSARALLELLAEGDVTIEMEDYANMEKVGPIGTELPRTDRQTTTSAGDIILYQGKFLVIYYDKNSWNFTRLGKVDGVSQAELKAALGRDGVTVRLSLK